MAPPPTGTLIPASLPEDPGPAPDSRWFFLRTNVLPVVERCMSAMQEGTQMVKLRGSSKGLVRFYYLDEHRSCLRWRPSRKNEKAKISIDSIQEVSEGRQSEIFQRYPDGSFDPNCCFSIYHGSHRESLDLVSPSGDEARTWVTGLRYLMAGISDEDSLARRQRTRDQWLKQTFDEADKNGDGSLSIGEVLQLLHKLNVNLPRQRVKQMFREADTDDHQGTLGFEEFCAFYKMMSTRRDLYLLLLTYSNHKDHLDPADLQRFLEVEQKMQGVTLECCRDIIQQFEPCPENKSKGVLGIDGFTNYTRSPAGDIFNPEHHGVHQDMTQPLSHYFITSSHNTYLVGDQLTSQSRADMYAWVLQAGCRCVEVDCWDGPDGEPIVHHGYTLTSKILFKDVIETINKYAFLKNEYPVILSIENHCCVVQQKKMAQYLTDILGDKLDLSAVSSEDASMLPSPQMLRGKVLVKGKKLPANISDDAEEGEVSDEDSADEIDEDCKLLNGDASTNRKRVENIAKKKLDSLIKESKIRDCEDPNDFTVSTMSPSGKPGHRADAKKSKAEEDVEPGEDAGASRRNSRLLMSSFSKRKRKGNKLKKVSSMEEGDEDPDSPGSQSRGTARQKKTVKLSRALSDLVKYTKSVGSHDVEMEVASSWQVSSFSETKAHQILQQKPAQYLRFNQHQLSRIYPSSYRVDSSNYNPQPFWNAGCQMVALNYQSEGRMLQLNRAKFSANGNCGYVLKPPCMCQGVFNPNSEDPLPGQLKKQLSLRIISGQQLPKPRDSMLGDRGEIIDPFVEVEVIGLPVDCSKEQTRVVDDNGFNPMWEETLVFTVHMPEIALVRFLVWDHDPIGRDFIGQRTLAFSSMMPGYRHVYLEGMEEASIFVHVAISDISGKAKQALGLKGLFLRGAKPGSLDSHAAGQPLPRPSVSQRLLRRTASAPTKSQKPGRKGFTELALGTRDVGSEGAADDVVPPSPGPPAETPAHNGLGSSNSRDARPFSTQRSVSPLCSLEPIAEEPALGPGAPAQAATPTSPPRGQPQSFVGPAAKVASPARTAREPPGPVQLRTGGQGDNEKAPRKLLSGAGPGEAREGATGSQPDSRSQPRALGLLPVVRRAKSEGQVLLEPLGAWRPLAGPSPTPAIYSDATGSDRIWQRLEPGSHRDSVSSSSSMSSSDTVIDLSLTSLGLGRSRESLAATPLGRLPLRPGSASTIRPDLPPVTKSKSNPNLRAASQLPPMPDALRPRPLAPRLPGPRPRPSWRGLALVGLQDCPVAAKSKSLGDLTADDFTPSFEGSSHSLGRSLGPPGRVQRDALTEQLRWLTGFQQDGDIMSPTSLGPAGDGAAGAPGFLRRSSSRSQSRVRAIASRARQAQERQQRLRGLDPRTPPEEERGTPEGACSVGHEGCVDATGLPKGALEQVAGAADSLLLLRL
ncbi:PREDICTED: 1-phosphatidylinositol 4,5-bisphosphate phosphodiesterase eta-2 isoform X1 [Chinchilla lanigera]|uniref:1-phosphatidylinositol 4,5-bisphosphate phosphodiesterase eta-2 isoform X1 n=1 Tax=Chinchilla lanigera TaxID=34839 RepID=UPI000698F79B|nr:PREDICTED: 1-phosphatidylinositol 4,5-bisphosphate phosphodiesterase eta-2 isoform X1 [Chinchilla lanigera]XP_013359624.1 PREDICTED: 1-phosphatidylinositol 4,5-bisphosphate phosphodiesterase eta-2 isoform X1 [Chinchilla lanigera]XP_013359626.1 PREDICTED: 1-phosphatidylinositol 4,5-bisphosphate phosphodiesterase eta-2 isoform X1 [Chinchilla lanigera]XP_013359627.1 PREDICTED: 1-phosphatidylinositol 4,5-bisphosphate phosphodiesterase eta-2 isoform X1 [Chinchilla lanigera]